MERIINFISKNHPFCLGFGPLSIIWAWRHKQKLSKLSAWIISKVESSRIKYTFFRASIFFRSHVWRGILDLMFFRGCRGISAKVWESGLKNAKTERNFNILVLGKKIMERFQSVETQLPSSQQLSPGKLKKMFASESRDPPQEASSGATMCHDPAVPAYWLISISPCHLSWISSSVTLKWAPITMGMQTLG